MRISVLRPHHSFIASAEVSQHALCLCVSDLLDDWLHTHHNPGNVVGSHSGLEVDDPALRHPQCYPHLPLQGEICSSPSRPSLSVLNCPSVSLFQFIPESARYNVSAGNIQAAVKTLEKIAKMNKTCLPPGRLAEPVVVSHHM